MAERYYDGPVSDHFDGLRFFNRDSKLADKGLMEVLRWTLTRKPPPWPEDIAYTTGLKPDAVVDGLRVTHIGHATTLLQVAGLNILVDPVYAERASPVSWSGPKRKTPPAIAVADLPEIHVVLVSHNHYDHMDLPTLHALWRRNRPRIIMPLGNTGFLQKKYPDVVVETGDWWQCFALADHVQLTMVPSYHWSSRKLGDYRKALWCGFVLETPQGAVYLAGDTAYRDGELFRELRLRWSSFCLALLPIGAYAPRYFMQPQHTSPEEAVQIALDTGSAVALGVHWGTFPLSDEPYAEPAERFIAALLAHGQNDVTGKPLRPGEIWTLVPSGVEKQL